MATLIKNEDDYAAHYGPTLNYVPEGGWDTRQPDKRVDTHCCFCGVQCGITLKVKENKVIGFEPREDFPVNRGKLCPKGVKRYLQNEHPDRLLDPLLRDPKQGFRKATWDEALDLVAANFKKIIDEDGPDSIVCWASARVVTEANYLLQKFARVAIGTNNIDNCSRT